MVYEIPEGIDPYDLIALAVIEQAFIDAAERQTVLADEARSWLDKHGCGWWEALGLEPGIFRDWMANLGPGFKPDKSTPVG